MIVTESLGLHFPASRGAAGHRLAFEDVALAQGEVLLLRGPSGSGKSSWLSLVAGLRPASTGRIEVAGQDLGRLDARALDAWRGRQVGLLPQRLHLCDALSVGRNLALAYYATGEPVDPAAIMASLRALGIADLVDRLPRAISVGQAQRVALARAVLRRPRVLLADEPTASLDDEGAQASIELLAQAAQACGATLVVSTHDQRAITSLRARFAGLHERVLRAGAPAVQEPA